MKRFIGLVTIIVGSCASHFTFGDVAVELVPLKKGNWFADRSHDKTESPLQLAAHRLESGGNEGVSDWYDLAVHDEYGFYLFYNNVTIRKLGSQYVIQIVKRTITDSFADGSSHVAVAFLVEALKLDNGQLKAPDQHYGSFALGDKIKRTIRKEFIVGVPRKIAKVNTDPSSWAWDAGKQYHQLHGYDDNPDSAPEIEFIESTTWELEFSVSDNGVLLDVPQFKIRGELSVPGNSTASQPANESTTPPIILKAGYGIQDALQLHKTTLSDAQRILGPPVNTFPQKGGNKNVEFSCGVIAHLNAKDQILTLMSAPKSAVRAELNGKMIAVGEHRKDVVEKCGQPTNAAMQDRFCAYDGLTIWFEADSVSKLVVH